MLVQWRAAALRDTHNTSMCFRCPRCNHHMDDLDHAFRCPRAVDTVKLHLDALREWLSDNTSHPDLADAILLCTQKWLKKSREQPTFFLAPLSDSAVITTLSRQYSYGWIHFMNGIHTSAITDLQQQYLFSVHSRKSATLWHSRLIRQLWKLTIKLYDERQDTLDAISPDLHDPTLTPLSPRLNKSPLLSFTLVEDAHASSTTSTSQLLQTTS